MIYSQDPVINPISTHYSYTSMLLCCWNVSKEIKYVVLNTYGYLHELQLAWKMPALLVKW